MKHLKLLAILSIFILSSCGAAEGETATSTSESRVSSSEQSSEKTSESSSSKDSKQESSYSESVIESSSKEEEKSSAESKPIPEESSSKQEEFDPANFNSLIKHLKEEQYYSFNIEMDTVYNNNSLKSIYDITPQEENVRISYYYEKYNKFDLDNLSELTDSKTTYNGEVTVDKNGQVISQEGAPINIQVGALQINNIFVPSNESQLVEWKKDDLEFTAIMMDNLPSEDLYMIAERVTYNENYRFDRIDLALSYNDTTTVNIVVMVNY